MQSSDTLSEKLCRFKPSFALQPLVMFLDHADAILNYRSFLIGYAEVCGMSSAVDTDI